MYGDLRIKTIGTDDRIMLPVGKSKVTKLNAKAGVVYPPYQVAKDLRRQNWEDRRDI
jgi:hypothetical protein